MSRTPSTMVPLGTNAPSFALPDADGTMVRLEQFSGAPALLVMFICNHCPFVQHVRTGLAALTAEYQKKGVAIVGINSNDAGTYPDDTPEFMRKVAKEFAFVFPYLVDDSQETAKAYHAACTPDFFLFDADKKLVYRGQMDSSRPGNDVPVTGCDLRAAIDAVLGGTQVPSEQRPSIGCNIKWKQGNEPEYFYVQ